MATSSRRPLASTVSGREASRACCISARAVRQGAGARLAALARGRKRHPADFYLNWRTAGLPRRPHRGHYAAPYLRKCEDEGCCVDVSWAIKEHPELAKRRAAEARLILLHREATGIDPPIQHGGQGVTIYLERRRTSGA
jgi:hypothetical protein